MSIYYLIRQTEYKMVKLRIVVAGQLTRHPQSVLYETREGRVGVRMQDMDGRWKEGKTFPDSYKLLGQFPSWNDADEERQKYRAVEQIHNS